MMPSFLRAAVFVLAMSSIGACASTTPTAASPAASMPRAATTVALQRVFRAPQVEPQWFAPSFLADTPLDEVRAMVDLVRDTLGDYQGAIGDGGGYLVLFSAGQRHVQAKLDEDGRFVVFVIGPA